LTTCEDASQTYIRYPAQERKKLFLSWFEPWKGAGEGREPPKKRYKEIFMTQRDTYGDIKNLLCSTHLHKSNEVRFLLTSKPKIILLTIGIKF